MSLAIDSAADLHFFAEGGANIIYTISSDETRLLRLRKDVANNADYVRTSQITAYLETLILPRFKAAGVAHAIAEHQLVRIKPNVLTKLNEDLLKHEEQGVRHLKRHGCEIETTEEYALLIPNLRPRHPTELTIEFKPKWLWSPAVPQPSLSSPHHSASGPMRQRRCTTCALRALHTAKSTKTYLRPTFCPLSLLRDGSAGIKAILQALLTDIVSHQLDPSRPEDAEKQRLYGQHGEQVLGLLTEAFVSGTAAGVLRVLAGLQEELDRGGILGLAGLLPGGTGDEGLGKGVGKGGVSTPPLTPALPVVSSGGKVRERGAGVGEEKVGEAEVGIEEAVQDYLLAMTLRDCTLFLRFPLDGSAGPEVVVADLDRKVPEGIQVREMRKVRGWAERERGMVDEGFYHGVELLPEGKQRDQGCWLWEERAGE